MLEKIVNKLERYRKDTSFWSELSWSKDESISDYSDKNEKRRTEVLIALQFDLQPHDESFIQFLMVEEVKNRSNDPFQGCTENLNRVGYLLASFRNPHNVDLFLKAKTANFDTHCGFDWEHILSAGVKTTFSQIENSEQSIKEVFHSYFEKLETCELSEKDIENWLNNRRNEWYLANPEKVSNEYWIDLAFELNELTLAKKMVDEFEKKNGDDKASLLTLKYYRSKLKDSLAQVEIAEKLLKFPKEDDMRAYDYIEISQLYLDLKDSEKAWDSIKKAIALKSRLDKGRLAQVADACIDIINTSDSTHSFFQECYQFGITHLGHFLVLQQAQKRLQAARRMKDAKSEDYFEEIYNQKKSELDDLLSSLK